MFASVALDFARRSMWSRMACRASWLQKALMRVADSTLSDHQRRPIFTRHALQARSPPEQIVGSWRRNPDLLRSPFSSGESAMKIPFQNVTIMQAHAD